jgi:hypothetical protein
MIFDVTWVEHHDAPRTYSAQIIADSSREALECILTDLAWDSGYPKSELSVNQIG